MSSVVIFDILYTETQRVWLHPSETLENDLVFKAAVEVFVWEDNRVENNHLRRDGHVTT